MRPHVVTPGIGGDRVSLAASAPRGVRGGWHAGRVRLVTDVERRARLGRRHALAAPVASPEAATEALAVLHATEPATVYLSLWARVSGLAVSDVDRALYDDRTLVKQLAMRRTLFVFPRRLLPAAWGSASARVARAQATRLAKEIESHGIARDGAAWLEGAREAVRELLADGVPRTAQELREKAPLLDTRIEVGAGTRHAATVAVAPRVLTQLGLEAEVVRARNTGHWRVSRPQWARMSDWLGESPSPTGAEEGYAELVARWLRSFGPGTEADLVWWLGATKTAVRRALADVGAVEVALEAGDTGWVLPDDLDEEPPLEPWAALLPVLDPTVMGWKQRDFYLGPHAGRLFDRNGNAGTTVWWDGRIVGCWVQDPEGVVQPLLLEAVPAAGRAAIDELALRLTRWLDGVRIGTVYPSPAMNSGSEATR